MKNLLYWIISLLDSNRGYATQTQKRFKKGDKVTITALKLPDTPYPLGEEVTIIEYGRYDYLVKDIDGVRHVVYQFEITDI